MESNETEEKTC